jgi:hypothetical protein
MTTEKIEKWQQIEYLERVSHKLFNLREAVAELSDLWDGDSTYDLDLNEQLEEKFPFSESFDELTAKVIAWTNNGEKNIISKKRELNK